jgi:hypothetical protein
MIFGRFSRFSDHSSRLCKHWKSGVEAIIRGEADFVPPRRYSDLVQPGELPGQRQDSDTGAGSLNLQEVRL